MSLKVQVNYVAQAGFDQASVMRSVHFPVDELIECQICQKSQILLAGQDSWLVVYDMSSADERTSTQALISQQVWEAGIVKMETARLTSVRYVSDYSFSKDATFYHNLKNSAAEPVVVYLQEYFFGAQGYELWTEV